MKYYPITLFLAITLLLATATMAAVPQQINYQGYLTNTGGSPLDTTVAMTFSLYNAATLGTQLWTESPPSVIVSDGLFNVHLGQLEALGDAVFNNPQVWLGITVGNNSEMTPRSRIVSVGYSYRVGTVDGASGGTVSSDLVVQGRGNFGSGNANTGTYAFVAGQNDTASGSHSTVSGGYSNSASAEEATVGGGVDNTASGDATTVGGGQYNDASGNYATVGGGQYNDASANSATVGGGYDNDVSGWSATVGGGRYNHARGQYSVVSGGGGETLADSNSAIGNCSVVAGGSHNTASADRATVGGGYSNDATHVYATVGGGIGDTASGDYFDSGRRL